MTREPCVLVVDDDMEIRETLDEYLGARGVDVVLAEDGPQMKAALSERDIDLVLLDLNLPGEGGMQLMGYLRANAPPSRNIGIIILTGVGDSEDRVLGLETGADDYVVKPFGLRELLARIHSVLRRTGRAPEDAPGAAPHAYRFADWTLDPDAGVIRHADGRHAELSSGELDLMKLLLERADTPVSRDELLSRSSHRELEPYDRSVDVRIARLRKKLEENPAHPQIIRTVRNVGYILVTRS